MICLLHVLLSWTRLAVSVMRRSGVRPSVRPIFFTTLIGRAAHTQRDSPGGSTRRGQHTSILSAAKWRVGLHTAAKSDIYDCLIVIIVIIITKVPSAVAPAVQK